MSSENVIDAYCTAFGMDEKGILPIGVARTDVLFDEEYRKTITKKIYRSYPELEDKTIILYAPTFRDKPFGRATFKPDLNFDRLSKELLPDQLIVITPHPVMSNPILEKDYPNIIEIRDVPTAEMQFVSDLLITDYSSIIFEYAMLDKPIVFFCYDYKTYSRDFYLDYDNDLPGKLLNTEEELIKYLKTNPIRNSCVDHSPFIEKWMSACDGNSTKRIVDLIEDKLNS